MHDRDQKQPRPRPRLSGTPADARSGPSGPSGDLPVVEGGGIPDLEEGGLTELEAAAMLSGFDDDEDCGGGGGPVISDADGIQMAGDDGGPPRPVASTPPPSFDAIPMADISPVPVRGEHAHDPSRMPHGGGDAGGSSSGGGGDPNEDTGRFRAIGVKAGRHEDEWSRTPNATGTGAIHVRTFMSKLTEDGFHALDARVNEWLDAHPQYEVKFVNTSIGTVTGKIKEPHLICQIWV